jgi:toxin YoeB
MTALLSNAFQEGEQLSEEAQNQIAEHLLQEVHAILNDGNEDETVYLMRSPANPAMLMQRLENIERGENLITVDIDDIMKNLTFEGDTLLELLSWARENPKIHQKIGALILDVSRNPFRGLGELEPLKYIYQGCWSRRIDDKHRLVYRVSDEAIRIVSCKYHYAE